MCCCSRKTFFVLVRFFYYYYFCNDYFKSFTAFALSYLQLVCGNNVMQSRKKLLIEKIHYYNNNNNNMKNNNNRFMISESVVNQNTCCNQVINQSRKNEIYNCPYNCGAQQHVHPGTYALHFYLDICGLTHTYTAINIITLNNSTIDWIIKTNLK